MLSSSAAASSHSAISTTTTKTDKNDELIEVYTEDGAPTGVVLDRDVIHREGHPHKVIHTWLINPQGQLVIQKRSHRKIAHPGFWDISSAGHIVHGETEIEAAAKELAEELGVVVDDHSRFEKLFTVFTHYVLNNGEYIDREWVDVFLVQMPELHNPREQLVVQEDEVDDVALIHYAQLEQLLRQEHPMFVPVTNEDYFQLFDILKERYPDNAEKSAFVDLAFLCETEDTQR